MWLGTGPIVPSNPYGHLVLFAEKKGGGGIRLRVDYCSLNAKIVTDAWPLPHIHDLVSQLKGAWVFSSLDLRDGYH